MSPRIVYLDDTKTVTADDIRTVADCNGWIEHIRSQIQRMELLADPRPAAKSALYYRQRALGQLIARRRSLL